MVGMIGERAGEHKRSIRTLPRNMPLAPLVREYATGTSPASADLEAALRRWRMGTMAWRLGLDCPETTVGL